jgi:Dynein light chain type 1
MSSERKAVIKSADMSEDMQQDAVDCASQALEKYNIEKVRTPITCCLISPRALLWSSETALLLFPASTC